MVVPSIQAEDSQIIKADIKQQENSKRKHGMKRHFKKMARHLELTLEQKTSIKAIFKELKSERVAIQESMVGFRQQVKSLMDSAAFDDQAFSELHSQYQTQFAGAALFKAKSKHAMMQILTAEQREKLVTFKGKRREVFL